MRPEIRLAALAGLLLALSAAGTYLSWRSRRAPPPVAAPAVKPAEAARLILSRPGVEIELRRVGDTWRLTRPVGDLADPNPVQDILEGLAALRVGTEVASDPASYPTYGLHEASATRVQVFSSAQAAAVLDGYFGKRALGHDSAYMRFSRERPVHVALGLADYQLERRADDFRERALVKFDRAELERIMIAAGTRRATLVKSTSGWTASGIKLAPDKAESLVERLAGLRVSVFAPESVTPSEHGLDQPALEAELSTKARRVLVRIGKPKPEGGKAKPLYRYARVEGRDALLLIPVGDADAAINALRGAHRPSGG